MVSLSGGRFSGHSGNYTHIHGSANYVSDYQSQIKQAKGCFEIIMKKLAVILQKALLLYSNTEISWVSSGFVCDRNLRFDKFPIRVIFVLFSYRIFLILWLFIGLFY
jgi:hypothetical protein